MREIDAGLITKKVSELVQDACLYLPDDVLAAIRKAENGEKSNVGKEVLRGIILNSEIAANEKIPLCQDTGLAVVWLEIGQDVHITGGDINSAINEGVRQGYTAGYLRKSTVAHPFSTRENLNDNTPSIIHTDIVPGDVLRIAVMPKGGGAENMSRLGMLSPSQGRQGIIDFVVKAVEDAGSNPCPPIIVGVGIGGTAEHTLLLAKKALLRNVGDHNPDKEAEELEIELLDRINRLGIGPSGFGGITTALAVNVEIFPAHIAMMPVAVNIQCHSARHKEAVL